ncbi:MAG: PAS domain-containing sensor histidine kinase [Bacteroidia bacterium]|nr:PAS domain-containing sensor histidine kinase [Bacteroidia bacterium]
MLVLFVSVACFYTSNIIGYRVVALILLMTVSFVAMLFEILPVLIAAILSAIIWNFFFIPPIFTFHIHNAEDVLMFLLYFFIALVNAVLTFKIREAEKKARDKEEKENTIKLYNTLLNSLSHELRTPISTILGAVDTLKEEKDKLTPKHETELLSEIDKASIRLNRQVENLLSMSRLESGMLKPKRDWCDVNELINACIHKLDPVNDHAIVFVPNEQLPLFKLDTGLLDQIMHNLIHNAIQYTPAGSIITVSALHAMDKCLIMVSDNGNGFPEKEIPLVFEKFYRMPNSKTGGSGLGLSIVKGFVEAMSGAITLKNNVDAGAVFTVEIPAETSFLNNLKNE